MTEVADRVLSSRSPISRDEWVEQNKRAVFSALKLAGAKEVKIEFENRFLGTSAETYHFCFSGMPDRPYSEVVVPFVWLDQNGVSCFDLSLARVLEFFAEMLISYYSFDTNGFTEERVEIRLSVESNSYEYEHCAFLEDDDERIIDSDRFYRVG